ncbi:putative F-box domain-containing protein [Medicago truncatula]|nr:F-box/kelch-repeat protein At3g23880 [Medicago truncatula]RHN63605.1 putative F-box domain-containing protein [Medicago truncatula]
MITFCDNRSKTRRRLRQHSQNVTVFTQSVSEITADMPEEIIVEILLRLPVRSLLQFRCVCKLWKTLISDPQFAKKHVSISTAYPQLVSVFVSIAKCNLVSYPLKPLLDNPSAHRVEPADFEMIHTTSMTIIGSCNGLLCLSDFYQFTLWNPSIKLKSKPSPTIIAFDSFDSKRFLYRGFGYDQVNDRYKVLAVVQNCYNLDETKTLIYTFGGKDWTTIQKFPCDPSRCDLGRLGVGKFVSGNLNWIVSKKVIVFFDIEKETYGEMSLPQDYGDKNTVLYVSSNRIYVSFDHSNKTHWVVWMMKEYGVVESWTKLMIIPQDKLTSPGPYCLSDALFISEHGVLLMRPQHSKLSVYNLNNDGGLDYCTTISGQFARYLHIYNESLVSPHWLKHSQKKNKRKRKQKLGSESPKHVRHS